MDPTGEIANIVAGGAAAFFIGGAFGFAGSAVSQLMSGERFSLRKAIGSAANGAVVGTVRGALITSGVGAGMAFASDFIGGAAGSALEQAIGNGRVSLKESLVSGATNAVSGTIYSMEPLKGLKGCRGCLMERSAKRRGNGRNPLSGKGLGQRGKRSGRKRPWLSPRNRADGNFPL